jgi:hypothetical protein
MQWENINDYYYAWAVYLAGAVGCSVAAWLFIRGLPRAVVHFFVITVMVLLFTPFALDAKNMVLAPAILFIAYGAITEGFASIKPVLKTVIIIWAVAIVFSLIYQLLTRNWYKSRMERRLEEEAEDYYELEDDRDVPGFDPKRNGFYPPKHTSLPGEIPIRAER